MLAQKTDAALALELLEVIEARRKIEKWESVLKEFFKTKMASLGVDTISAGGVLISLVEKSRSSLDRKALVAALGEDGVRIFEKETQYLQVDVKAMNEKLGAKAA